MGESLCLFPKLRGSELNKDLINAFIGILLYIVLPKPDHLPAPRPQFAEISFIPLASFGYLLFPKVCDSVFPCRKTVPMPKISVNENNYPRFRKYYIRTTGQIFDVFSKSQPFLVKFRTNELFKPCIFSLYSGHAITALLSSQIIRHYPVLGTG